MLRTNAFFCFTLHTSWHCISIQIMGRVQVCDNIGRWAMGLSACRSLCYRFGRLWPMLAGCPRLVPGFNSWAGWNTATWIASKLRSQNCLGRAHTWSSWQHKKCWFPRDSLLGCGVMFGRAVRDGSAHPVDLLEALCFVVFGQFLCFCSYFVPLFWLDCPHCAATVACQCPCRSWWFGLSSVC